MKALKPLACAAAIALAAMAASGPAHAQERASIVAQKLRLLGGLLDSPRAKQIAASGEPSTQALYAQARRLHEEASALEASQPERAEPLLDNALRLISQAGSKASGAGALASSQLRQQNADLLEQVRTYRTALAEVAQRDADAHGALEKIDQLAAQAERQAGAGRLGDANRLLAQGYQLAIASLAKARAGETVVIDLRFDTPADEFAYEQRRFRSHQMLLEMTLAEGRASEGARKAVEGYFAQGRDGAAKAEAQAAAGEHVAAIRAMEDATRHLRRGLQLLGMQVF